MMVFEETIGFMSGNYRGFRESIDRVNYLLTYYESPDKEGYLSRRLTYLRR